MPAPPQELFFPPGASWQHALWLRLTAFWPVKMASNIVGFAAFFAAYFWVLHHPQFPVTVMPVTVLDHWIAFRPAAMALYVSLWLYVPLPLALLRSRRELACYGSGALALSALGLLIFLAWPTTVPAFGVDWSEHASVAFLKTVDAGNNACPSLHVAFAVFSAAWLAQLLREMKAGFLLHLANWSWCAGIVYSTLATRQHVVLDVVAGIALAAVVAWPNLWALRRLAAAPTHAHTHTPSQGRRAGRAAR